MDERRSAIRQKSFMHGVVYFNHRRSTADCLVRDLTDHGAHLHFDDLVTLPDSFELHIPNKDMAFHADMIWHKGHEMGVTLKPLETQHAAAAPAEGVAIPDSIAERLARLEHQYAALKRRVDALQGE